MVAFGLVGLLIALLITAAIAAGAEMGLEMFLPSWSLRRRAATAALVGGFLFMAVPIISAATDNDTPVAALVALVVMGLLLAGIAGLPAALLVGRRKGQAGPDPATFD